MTTACYSIEPREENASDGVYSPYVSMSIPAPRAGMRRTKMRRLILPVCLAIFATIAPAQQKKRVAVFNFDYATVQSSSAAIFGTRPAAASAG